MICIHRNNSTCTQTWDISSYTNPDLQGANEYTYITALLHRRYYTSITIPPYSCIKYTPSLSRYKDLYWWWFQQWRKSETSREKSPFIRKTECLTTDIVRENKWAKHWQHVVRYSYKEFQDSDRGPQIWWIPESGNRQRFPTRRVKQVFREEGLKDEW